MTMLEANEGIAQFRMLVSGVVKAHGGLKLDQIIASYGIDPARVPRARVAELIPALKDALAKPATLPPRKPFKPVDWEVCEDRATTSEEYMEQDVLHRVESVSDLADRLYDTRRKLGRLLGQSGAAVDELLANECRDCAILESQDELSDGDYRTLYEALRGYEAQVEVESTKAAVAAEERAAAEAAAAEQVAALEAELDRTDEPEKRRHLYDQIIAVHRGLREDDGDDDGGGVGGGWLRALDPETRKALDSELRDRDVRCAADPALAALCRRPDELIAAGAGIGAVQAALCEYYEALAEHRAKYPSSQESGILLMPDANSLGLLMSNRPPTGAAAAVRAFALQSARIKAATNLRALAERADGLSAQAKRDQTKVADWRAALYEVGLALDAHRLTQPAPAVPQVVQFGPLAAAPIKRKANGRVEASYSNVFAAAADPAFLGVLIARDTFRDEIMLSIDGGANWRPFTDADYSALHRALDEKGFVRVASEVLRACVNEVAERRRFDTAKAWLEQVVPAWDGVPRVERFMSTYLGAEDTPYARAVSRYTWTGLAGRVLQPGCKADMVPVLVGPQGSGKSTAIREISPDPEFYTEIDIGERDENLSRQLRGTVVAEIAELRGLASRDAESIKAWITRTHESWIPKYREFKSTFPRRCIFFGSTNESEFLSDPTGERRWLPVEIGEINLGAIKADRLQLWAEAREMFRPDGIDFREAEVLARNEHAKYKRSDPWGDQITAWLEEVDADGVHRGDKPFTSNEVLGCAVGLTLAQQRAGEARRVSGILRELGYERDAHQRRTDNGRLRYWRKRV